MTTSFINTEDFSVRNEIEVWMEHINGTIDNKNSGDYDTAINYGTGTAKLVHYQQNGDITMTYEFVDIWPTSLSEIALSYDTSSEIEQFDCTWAYNYYTQTGGTAPTKTGNVTQG